MIWVDLKSAEINHLTSGVNNFDYSKADVLEVFSAYSKIEAAVVFMTKRYRHKKIASCLSFRGLMDLTSNVVMKEFEGVTRSLEIDKLWCMSFLNTNIKFHPIFELHKIQERLFDLKAQGLIEKVKLTYTEIDAEETVWKNYLDDLMKTYDFDFLEVETDACYEFSKKYGVELIRSFSSVYKSEKVYEPDEIDWSLPNILVRKERLDGRII